MQFSTLTKLSIAAAAATMLTLSPALAHGKHSHHSHGYHGHGHSYHGKHKHARHYKRHRHYGQSRRHWKPRFYNSWRYSYRPHRGW